ncbi:tRNA methyltransferase complex GCD14 subunit [Xylariomycetidae sp. FL2044]|nr:tRNA methyltransferase complex GCD14 subunit [Xylariomycetidae sp. FL2044]
MSDTSFFLSPRPRTTPNTLAIIHLSRENVQPVYLQESSGIVDGYVEGAVINTRFGSFPHSTLIGQEWGSQIRASIVDTGSRGRKRKLENPTGSEVLENDTEETGSGTNPPKNVKTATSGFIHILPPTPELWTTSLPHRTQVVYTPDYSYILQRIRARPGMSIIEAGAGSGSFTHAAARAIYNGDPKDPDDKKGKVWSFEFNEARYHKMQEEIEAHRLNGLVQITHRDVYNGGFLVDDKSPEAECVFLDLPAPWRALPHISRSKPSPSQVSACDLEPLEDTEKEWISPLRADRSVYLCTFSPCIEQVTKTVDTMRRLGWVDIEMVEVAHRRINVMRERIGLNMPSERGANQSPASVDEAIMRLKEVEGTFKSFHGQNPDASGTLDDEMELDNNSVEDEDTTANDGIPDGPPLAESDNLAQAKPWTLGRLIHRTEPEIKTHTSYLIFAILPQEWSEAQEAAAFQAWPCGDETKVIGTLDKAARKQEKRDLLKGKKGKKRKSSNNKAAGNDASVSKKTKAS